MKKILSILLALALMLGATFALAEGNVTIAVQGMNDFNDYIQSMVVYGDRLLLSSWDRLYTWDNATRKLTEVDGYSELESTLTGDGENPGGAWYPDPTEQWKNNSRVVSNGNYVMMVVHENCDDIVSAFNDLF